MTRDLLSVRSTDSDTYLYLPASVPAMQTVVSVHGVSHLKISHPKHTHKRVAFNPVEK
ncbi:hypothetical protein BDP55DRAFT_670881 [Colletotrichum godetiae]|uniref:Uncharacterized protein n=1 Tax=Colletotrichum godetiae TaxID=1209918 RepID=A0AAJ0AIF4_9PEZI|nr:uncharacterized protein BDP55DRAFT_670881 [Colletotrichum godetiae]KAK1673033.1 hypothetical protein BDP55DRAFT_670881 [Colletotrichum godetiae]